MEEVSASFGDNGSHSKRCGFFLSSSHVIHVHSNITWDGAVCIQSETRPTN